jgi:hypothetical protein
MPQDLLLWVRSSEISLASLDNLQNEHRDILSISGIVV